MASMGNVPDVARNKMSFRSCQKLQKNALFALKKVNIALFPRGGLIVFLEILVASRGPTPGRPGRLKVFNFLSLYIAIILIKEIIKATP